MSLRYYYRRAEHWAVVSGAGPVTRGEEVFTVCANETTFLPEDMAHRPGNCDTEPLVLIEMRTGDLLSEEDIVRMEHVYGRIGATCREL